MARSLHRGHPVAIATETFTLRATRFTYELLQTRVGQAAERRGLRCWMKVGDGRLRRDVTVTVSGEPETIRDLMTSIESIQAPHGDNPGPGF